MASAIRIQATSIYVRSGLVGTANVDDAAGVVDGATSLTLANPVTNLLVTTTIPVGATFLIAGESAITRHTVTATTESAPGVTETITFSPSIAAGSTIPDGSAITVGFQQVAVVLGDNNLTFTEDRNIDYDLDRGVLSGVTEGDEAPVSLNLGFRWCNITTGTNEPVSIVEAIKGIGAAADWPSTGDDPCEPYAVDLVFVHTPACTQVVVESDVVTFEEFRYDQLSYDLSAASISVTGRSNRTEARTERILPSLLG